MPTYQGKFGFRYRQPSAWTFQSNMKRKAAATIIKNKMRQYLIQKRRKKTTSGVGITTQHDQRLIYRKKMMPKRKKKKWKSFIRRVNAVSEKELGSRQIVFNNTFNYVNTTAGKQGWANHYLYSQSSNLSWANDLNNVSSYENTGSQTSAAGDTVYNSTKFLFQSAVLDMTLRNASTNNNQPDSRAKLEVDVYECLMSKDALGQFTFTSFGAILAENAARTDVIGGNPANAKIDFDLRGVTPFEMSYSLSRFGIKILKKTKYFLPNGETFTYQVRDPKRRSITRKDMADEGGFNRPGWTRIIYVVFKLVPGLTVGEVGTSDVYQEKLSIGATRKYFYKIEGVNEDRTLYGIA